MEFLVKTLRPAKIEKKHCSKQLLTAKNKKSYASYNLLSNSKSSAQLLYTLPKDNNDPNYVLNIWLKVEEKVCARKKTHK